MSVFGTSTPAHLRAIERRQAEIEAADPCPFPDLGKRRRRPPAVKPATADPLRTGNRFCASCAERGVKRCVSCNVTEPRPARGPLM